MRPITYSRADDTAGAVTTVSADPTSDYLAGGTTEIDLLRRNVLTPRRLVDITGLPLTGVEEAPDGGLRIGALARMSEVAASPLVRERFPAVAEALEAGASPQLRHMATMGGNLLQRVRCTYYRDAVSPCNKRDPGSGCSALEGFSRGHAVLGTSAHCIAAHPSDVAVALAALDARVHTLGRSGEQVYGIDDFFLTPAHTPHREHPLEHGELITAIELPSAPVARRSVYLKVRDRASYEFALASAAGALSLVDGTIADVRLALGGVATKPWRAHRAEGVLLGAPATRDAFAEAARVELADAHPTRDNAFKVDLAQRVAVRVLETLTANGRTS
ncbi:carbon-monoxide dehydrogenase medium subunit [Streptomyces daqingensis]|uniref:Carbon-monoxide dehydrogenase medium subunit n=1 Tax=Streptomyces daqingensis TaxID=1472640 RepID=A0ABQ2M5Y3_9ACTN|nr:xanthine dehydrogenase family protein subunit M [Streptomyces daqingensis]GGO47127.1 carbon-monoxide dehydrogenase medium subunit [Streptomyces daqingensis]